jgi:hypothetical protein
MQTPKLLQNRFHSISLHKHFLDFDMNNHAIASPKTVGSNVHSHRSTPVVIPAKSEGFECIRSLGNTLFVIDAENLNYSLASSGFQPDYAAINDRIARCAQSLETYAFMTSDERTIEHKRRYFSSASISAHLSDVNSVLTVGQLNRHLNSDNDLLLRMGYYCGKTNFDSVVLGTGDGELGCAAANFLAGLAKPPRLYVLSVEGTTSNRLHTSANWLINGNLTLGADLVRPVRSYSTVREWH